MKLKVSFSVSLFLQRHGVTMSLPSYRNKEPFFRVALTIHMAFANQVVAYVLIVLLYVWIMLHFKSAR